MLKVSMALADGPLVLETQPMDLIYHLLRGTKEGWRRFCDGELDRIADSLS